MRPVASPDFLYVGYYLGCGVRLRPATGGTHPQNNKSILWYLNFMSRLFARKTVQAQKDVFLTLFASKQRIILSNRACGHMVFISCLSSVVS